MSARLAVAREPGAGEVTRSLRRIASEPHCVLWLTEFLSPLDAAWAERQVREFSASEQQRLARIRRVLRREQFVVGHVLLRRLLEALGVADPIVETAPDGAPRLAGMEGRTGWHLSLAHCEGAVAALVSTEPAGVDIERQRTLRDPIGLADFLGRSGSRAASSTAGDASASALEAWVIAEARAKAGRIRPAGGAVSASWRRPSGDWRIAVAGSLAMPRVFVHELSSGTYNPAKQKWSAAP